MRKTGTLLVVLLFFAACGASDPVVKTQVHLVKGMDFETLLEGTADLDGGRIEQSIKDKPLPIDLQVVVTREGQGEDYSQKTLTFHVVERNDRYVLVHDADSGASEPVDNSKADGVDSFLKNASHKIADIVNVEREAMRKRE